MNLQIPIIDRSEPDCLAWFGTNDGNYTVKSGYNTVKS
jgi:hypothetical protein